MTDLINELRAQLAEVTTERDEMLRRIGANETAQLLTEAVKKQCEDTAQVTAELEAEREAVAALGRSFDAMRAERDAEREVRRAMEQYVQSSTPDLQEATRMRDAALALAAKLPA